MSGFFIFYLTGIINNLLPKPKPSFMKRILLILLPVLIYSADSIAQKNFGNSIRLYFARSFHGTGDLPGVLFTAEYGHFFKKRLEISGNITSTIHWGSFGLFVTNQFGTFDESFRYGTAGIQAGSKLGYTILNFPHYSLKIQGGSFFRFQSSSASGGYGLAYPPSVNYPEPVFTFRQVEKQNLFTIGYLAELSYTFMATKNLLLGVTAGFQNDTNADVITYYGIFIGRKIRFAK